MREILIPANCSFGVDHKVHILVNKFNIIKGLWHDCEPGAVMFRSTCASSIHDIRQYILGRGPDYIRLNGVDAALKGTELADDLENLAKVARFIQRSREYCDYEDTRTPEIPIGHTMAKAANKILAEVVKHPRFIGYNVQIQVMYMGTELYNADPEDFSVGLNINGVQASGNHPAGACGILRAFGLPALDDILWYSVTSKKAYWYWVNMGHEYYIDWCCNQQDGEP